MERETGFEPTTSSLGIQSYVGSKSLARFCCEFLNLQPLAESAFSNFNLPIEAQMRHLPHTRSADCNAYLQTSMVRSHRKARIIRDDVMPASGEDHRRRRFSTTQQKQGSIG